MKTCDGSCLQEREAGYYLVKGMTCCVELVSRTECLLTAHRDKREKQSWE